MAMVKYRKRHSRPRRTSRRSIPDILPFSLAGQALPLPVPEGEGGYTPSEPMKWEIILLDGGAVDALFRGSLSVPDPNYLEGGQALNRGISFKGMEFWWRLAFRDDPSEIWSHAYAIGTFRFMCALVKRPWGPLNGPARDAMPLPNLFSRDEAECGDILYRWPLYLGPVPVYNADDPNYSGQLVHVDTQGGSLTLPAGTSANALLGVWANGGSASNQTHHRVRNRRFLDEDHYLSFVINATSPFAGQNDTTEFALDAQGVMKTKNR